MLCFDRKSRWQAAALGVFKSDKSLSESASAAEVLGGFSALEALYHSDGPRGGKNFIDILLEDIPQCDCTLTIQTARDNRTVTKDTKLIS